MIAAKRREVASQGVLGAAIAPNWKLEWRDSFTQLAPLLEFLQLDTSDFSDALALDAAANFPLRVPLSFARRMAKADPLGLRCLHALNVDQGQLAATCPDIIDFCTEREDNR